MHILYVRACLVWMSLDVQSPAYVQAQPSNTTKVLQKAVVYTARHLTIQIVRLTVNVARLMVQRERLPQARTCVVKALPHPSQVQDRGVGAVTAKMAVQTTIVLRRNLARHLVQGIVYCLPVLHVVAVK